MGDLDPQGRMARVLVRVDDPLKLSSESANNQQLLMGSYVRTEISGKRIPQVARLPRPSIHTNDTVWIMREDGTLAIRPVTIVWRTGDSVLISEGISAGDNLIVSNLAAPVDGMQVRVVEESTANES
jgi:hypothetical protein